MIAYIWPIALVVASNVLYQVCAKEVPSHMNPLASLTLTYVTGAIVSGLLFFILNKDADLVAEYKKVNWAPFVLGFVIVGLEVGFIYAYKAGWPVSTASVVQSSFLAVILIAVGYFLYKEDITLQKILGICVCLIGLYIVNR